MLQLSAGWPITCTNPSHQIPDVKIPATLQPLLDTGHRELPSLLKQLQVGQILPAKVLAELKPGLLRLQLAATELLARSEVRLAAGTDLRLEVIKGQPLPELRILREPTSPDLREQAARFAIARQLPATEVRQALTALKARPLPGPLTEAVRQLGTVLQEAGIRPTQLTAEQLRQAVNLSGLFHEARLAAGLPIEPADTKTRLLQLLAMLKGNAAVEQRPATPPPAGDPTTRTPGSAGDSLLNRLIRLVEGSVARIQLQQTAALAIDDSQRQAWQIDLPIHLPDDTDDLMLRIEREASRGDTGGEAAWAVKLAFTFDSIGTLQCRIALAGERVATTFWCEQADTSRRLEQRLPSLRDALEAQGLEVVHLAGTLGVPPAPLMPVPMPDQLLDEHA